MWYCIENQSVEYLFCLTAPFFLQLILENYADKVWVRNIFLNEICGGAIK
jgi:hypothetical protein